ncbi:unnamed protein product [Heligmosomoides polygyrus]|uniref:HTH_48 domain-containing protein n=1 Tax=Heligmosomoides polygyrus TaxID=6339 RepID=A0A183FUZ5_HELPZ|nr:unnamed protein product [Heligmosomoides polygyrus]
MSTINSSMLRPIVYYEFLQGHFARTAGFNICAIKEEVVHYSAVARWYQRFNAGDISPEDRPRSGRPSVVEEDSLREAFKVKQIQPLANWRRNVMYAKHHREAAGDPWAPQSFVVLATT